MLLPAVKRVHWPLVLPDGRIQFGLRQYGVASEVRDDEAGSLRRLLSLLDGTRDVATVWAELHRTHPAWELRDVQDVIDQLAAAGHVEDLGAPLPADVTAAEADRYRSCREFFAWVDGSPRSSPYEVQARIRRAKVALLGLGGTGSSVAASLVATGIGALHCVDFDLVEGTNLTRQLIYEEADVGRPKVDAALARLRALNSTVAITGQSIRVESAADIAPFIRDADAAVLCADEPADVIQLWMNEAALRARVPWYIAAYTGAMTGIGGFVPVETGCWVCLTRSLAADDAEAGGEYLFTHHPHAVVAASAAVIGHLCALEILYQIGGLPTQVRGRVFQFNLASWDHQYFVDAVRDPDCPACGGIH